MRRPPNEPAPFDVALDQAAQHFLDADPHLRALSETIELSPERFVERAADLVSKATRAQHLKALAFAYALWLRASRNPAYERFVDKLRQRRQRYNKLTTDLHLLVEAVVTYGSDDPDERRDKRGLYQRDVSALRYLHHRGVGPGDVEDRATKTGEGLDAWARQWPKVRQGGAAGARDADAVKLGIEVVVRTRAPDGAVTTERYAFADNDESRHLLALLREAFRDEEKASGQPAPARPAAPASADAVPATS